MKMILFNSWKMKMTTRKYEKHLNDVTELRFFISIIGSCITRKKKREKMGVKAR